MKITQLALGFLATATLAAPSFAANTATAVACVEPSGDSSQVRSGFASSGGTTIWTGACVRDKSDKDKSGVGVRIDTQTGSGAFQLQSTSTGDADPGMFYIYGAGGGNRFISDSGINVTDDIHGNQLWSFAGVPHGYKMVSIYFADFGSSKKESFQDVVFPPAVDGGHPTPSGHGYVSDCNIDFVDPF